MNEIFEPADILLPSLENLEDWPVVACDQYTSQPDYWKRIYENVKDKPSSLHMILPETWLETGNTEEYTRRILSTMDSYLKENLFTLYPSSFVYVERTLSDQSIRRGLVGMVDLEEYDYSPASKTPIRATEKTVPERIPPRLAIRTQAPLEMPHVLLLADDTSDLLLEPLESGKEDLPVLYDFDLMENGGHITGWLVNGASALAFKDRLASYRASIPYKYEDLNEDTFLFAVGDGNHSLACAKDSWEAVKRTLTPSQQQNHPARFALVELENIHDPSLQFEPIHRLVFQCDPQDLLASLKAENPADQGTEIRWFTQTGQGTLHLNTAPGQLPVGVLQSFLDRYLADHPGSTDYIHGDKDLQNLALQPNCIGFLLPALDKSGLFRGVISDGSLPRKTFSMGHANEKRYYLEVRKIK